MIEPESHRRLQQEISERIVADRNLLDSLRAEIRPLRSAVERIQPRTATSISLVGTDGGNNTLQFDPFLVQLIRIVDSSNNEYCLEAITPSTNIEHLSAAQFNADGQPITPLGRLMAALEITKLQDLSHMIHFSGDGNPKSSSWVKAYRELVEWATLYSILHKDFGTDTLIVFDGLLRSKVFARDNFAKLLRRMSAAIAHQYKESRRHVYLVGVAKHSKVLDRYRLAMALERVLTTNYPAYIEIPREIEEKAYVSSEYARGDDREIQGGDASKLAGGKMFFVKFGGGQRDPIWPVDIFLPQREDAQTILGYLLADALDGFPVPLYPRCLQKAHENAALVDFDFDILQDEIFAGIRATLGADGPVLDVFRLQDVDVAQRRYG